MLILASVAVISVGLIAALVWIHASKPDNKYLNSAKDWQTLIGALLGFLFLSGSVVVSEVYQSEVEADRSAATQRAYAKILSNELNLYRQDLEVRSSLFAPKERPFTTFDCAQTLTMLGQMPLASFSLERNLSDLVPSFTDEFNFIATSAIEARFRYMKETSSFDLSVCANDPATYRDGLDAYHKQAIGIADGMQASLISTFVN